MASKVTVDPGKLTQFSAKVLQKVGVPLEDAERTAGMLVAADLRGIDSHGVSHLGSLYIRRIKEGLINPKPQIKMVSLAQATAVVDGDRGLGFVVGFYAMTEALKRAGQTGAGFVSVRNSTHCGAASTYAMMALPKNMIGIALTTGGRAMVAPGSVGRGAGINVISVAVPTQGDAPFVLDMATTVVAGSKFEIALRSGQATVPDGWAVDKAGKPLTDPKKYAEEGALLPLGGLPETGAFKGFGLSVMVDILCSILAGSVSISELLTQPDTALRANHFFGALKIGGFMSADDFARAMAGMVKVYHDLPKAPGVEKIYLAGEVEHEIEKQRRHGIPLDQQVIASLQELAAELGVEYDL
ncbi:MAG: Ldh family oxidoreductase [Syntrophales bacterium]|nr:Ldh family oxidoreductase [Syntrophales bacterium]